MTVRKLSTLAVAAGLWLANPTFAKDPVRPAAPQPATSQNNNQELAEAVAQRIGKSGAAAGAQVQVTTRQGVVELTGSVLSLKQADRIVQQAMLLPGVVRVETNLKLLTSIEMPSPISPAQAIEPSPIVLPGQPMPGSGVPMNLPPGAGVGMVPPMGYGMGPQDPIPLQGPQMSGMDMSSGPKMPPFAWPTYAPYPNMSRVAYPQAYPYNAFPFIGPYYPFPKVPLGWRSVKLEWEDGHWYLGRLSTPHDYWRVKFW